MRRGIAIALLIMAAFLLQSTVLQSMAIGSISPNLMIILASSFGFMGGKKEGLLTGFFCGILEDIFFGHLLGMHALIYMYIGYCNGYFNRIFYQDDIKLPITLISVSELLYGLGTYAIMFLMRSKFAFSYYLIHIIVPELIYTILTALLVYPVVSGISRRLEEE